MNKLKILATAICCLVTTLWTETQGMQDEIHSLNEGAQWMRFGSVDHITSVAPRNIFFDIATINTPIPMANGMYIVHKANGSGGLQYFIDHNTNPAYALLGDGTTTRAQLRLRPVVNEPPALAVLKIIPLHIGLLGDGTNYDQGEVVTGYGSLTQAGVEINGAPGGSVTAKVNINLAVEAVTNDTMTEWLKTFDEKTDHRYSSQIEESKTQAEGSASLFWKIFGISGGAKYDNYNKSEKVDFSSSDNKIDKGFTDTLNTIHNSKATLTGEFNLTSTSVVPVKASVYVKTAKITFSNKQSVTFIDTGNPVVANTKGEPLPKVNANGNLKILPIGFSVMHTPIKKRKAEGDSSVYPN